MQMTDDGTNYQRERLSPFLELEEGFDDWAKWIRSISQPSEGSLIAEPPEQRRAPGNTSLDEDDNDGRQEEDWCWRDDGGESSEVI